MTRLVLKLTEQFALKDFLEGKIEKLEDGTCKYIDGYSDKAIAKLFGAQIGKEVTRDHISRLRVMQYGSLIHNDKKPNKIDDRITKLENRLARLEASLGV